MDYDINVRPEQIIKLAAWVTPGEDMRDVELAVDDRMLVAVQGDELMAWDLGGEEASEVYLDANPPLDPTGSARHREAYALLAECSRMLDSRHAQKYDDMRELGARVSALLVGKATAPAHSFGDWGPGEGPHTPPRRDDS